MRRLAMMFGSDERNLGAGMAVYYTHIRRPEGQARFELSVERVPVSKGNGPALPTICLASPSASWYEREIHDVFGISFEGAPDARPLLRHGDPEDYPFLEATGEGTFEIPVGPVHAGVIEPGHFRFTSIGEKVLHLELRLFYKHRGIEGLAEGMSFAEGVTLAERIAGDEAVSSTVAYCRALEEMAEIFVPERAEMLRLVFMELERLHSHLMDLVGIATDVAFGVGAMAAARLRETVLRRAALLTGSRFMNGAIVPGGVSVDLADLSVKELKDELEDLRRGIEELRGLLLGRSSVVDRLAGTGVLPREHAVALATVGPVARANGIDYDARRDLDIASQPYDRLPEFSVPKNTAGDCLARTQLRFAELEQSIDLIEAACGILPSGPTRAPIPGALPGSRYAIGATEAPRGENLHFVMTSADGRSIRRYKPRPPSRCNWPALPFAFAGDIVPDFPLVNKSFNLSYSANDL